MNIKDKIPGGLADKKSPKDFNAESLKEGIKVELEHTSDKDTAREIAMDHLTEDSSYYKKLKEVEKKDHIEVTADGKQELVEGKEPLKKDPRARWAQLKKALDHAKAFMSIEDAMKPDEDEEAPAPVEQPQDAPEQSEEPSEGDEEAPEEQDESSDDGQEEPDSKESEENIIQALKDEGYSEPEIAFIVHGHHSPELNETDAAKAQVTNAMGDVDVGHAKRKADVEHEHTKRMNDLEHEKAKNEMADPETEKNHRKRMLDLEYETASGKKKQVDMELEHKKRMQDVEYQKAHSEANKKDPSEDLKHQEAQLQFNAKKKELEKEDPTDAMQHEQLKFELEMKRKEKEFELEYKKKELELKLKLTVEAAKQKAAHASQQMEADAGVNSQVKENQAKHKIAESKKPPAKEPAKPAGKK